AVMRRDAVLAEDYASRHNVPKFYTDALKLINDPEINAVYIATPPSSHAEYALKAIKSGKPVYIEKPMALNYKECLRINKASENSGIPVFVAYYRRALPGFVKVKEMILNGAIGNTRFVQLRLFKSASDEERSGKLSWRVEPKISGGGHFFDLASHQLDYLDFLFGPVRKVRSFVLNQAGLYKAEDYVSAEFLFGDNIAGTGTWCFSASAESSIDSIEIIGDKGLIRFSCFDFIPIVLENQDGRTEFENVRPEHVQIYLIEQVVKALIGKSTTVSTGITAARTSKVMDEIVKEYYNK
ncbi:MAG: Gfo/Idh/MocA family oxidoreductase, partial [Bacteroidia bacterium]|nr:Gfo/Idh/MocA family oxidoreductase [Bacteroidia bacterium]